MGHGRFNRSTYDASLSAKRSAGYASSFAYTEDIAAGRAAQEVHPTLDPKLENKNGPNTGKNIRESFDNDEHPESLAIAVLFDVTGSMKRLPLVLQEKLPKLHGLLVEKRYVEHPQIMFGAIGDAYSDKVPLQVGQFESDNTMDENLSDIYLEGAGGGGNHESYNLGAYFLARHTDMDCWNKRKKKGYAFFIGDERQYATIDPDQVKALIGDDMPQPVTTKEIYKELQERFEVFYLFAAQGSYQSSMVLPETVSSNGALGWSEVLGEQAIVLDNASEVCETIALTLGVMEGTITLEAGLDDLKEIGLDGEAAGRALVGAGVTGERDRVLGAGE